MSTKRTDYARRKGYASAASSKQRGLKKPASTKNRIRSLQRLLKKTEDEEQKTSIREQLKELDKKMRQNRQQELERKFAIRYHKVKFFERQKVRRRLRSVSKELASLEQRTPAAESVAERDALLERKRRLEEDMVYIDYYPKDEKYYSLFGRSQGVDDPKTEQLRTEMRERALKNFEDAKAAAENRGSQGSTSGALKNGDVGESQMVNAQEEGVLEVEEPDEEDEEADDEDDGDEEEDEDDEEDDDREDDTRDFFMKARTRQCVYESKDER